jgi:hypothetical protein
MQFLFVFFFGLLGLFVVVLENENAALDQSMCILYYSAHLVMAICFGVVYVPLSDFPGAWFNGLSVLRVDAGARRRRRGRLRLA